MFELTEIKRKKPKPAYKKTDAVKELEKLANEEANRLHPGQPFLVSRTFRDDKANDLTKCITTYITFRGGFASRISKQGTYNSKLR